MRHLRGNGQAQRLCLAGPQAWTNFLGTMGSMMYRPELREDADLAAQIRLMNREQRYQGAYFALRGVSSGILSDVTLIRAVAIGFLAGGAGALIFDPRGEGLDHLRLALLMGLLVGQFLTVPVSLVGGVVWARLRKGRPIRPYDFSIGSLLMALGVLVVTQAQAAVNWLSAEPTPGGVGDPDGEISIAGLAGLSGCLMVLVGLALLANGVWTSTRTGSLWPTMEASQD